MVGYWTDESVCGGPMWLPFTTLTPGDVFAQQAGLGWFPGDGWSDDLFVPRAWRMS